MRHRSSPWIQSIRVSLLVGSFIMLVHGAASAAIFCVSTASELASALLTAKNNGADDIIRVVQGTYDGPFVYDSSEAFSLTIEGGYVTGCSSRVVNPTNTTLDGRRAGTALALIATTAANFVVDGLTLQNGLETVSNRGGGVYVDAAGGNLRLTNNVIRDSGARSFSSAAGGITVGPIFRTGATTVTLTNNMISQNTSGGGSGGIFVSATTVTLTNNTISQNTGYGPGGIFVSATTVTLTNNTISQNVGNSNGGIFVDATTIILINSVISQNTASSDYGGADLRGTAITLTNNTITENRASRDGGGLSLILNRDSDHADIYNNIILGNSATRGADLFLDNDGNRNGVPSPVKLFNNDFDQSAKGTFMQVPFVIDPSNLNNLNPLFVNPANGDYHLQAGSLVIDKGNNSAPSLPPTDKDGKPRIVNGIVDMGAYEWSGSGPLPTLTLALTGCTHCRTGDRFTVQAHVTNVGTTGPVEAKIGVRLPSDAPTNLLGKHLEVTLPAGLDTTVTVFDITLPSGLPTGTWTFEGALLEPELGATLSRSAQFFDMVP